MRLSNRESVDGTEPCIYIGRRLNRDKRTGELVESNRYWAEYCVDGHQQRVGLETTNRDRAIQAAWEVHRCLRAGQGDLLHRRATLEEVMDSYLKMLRDRGRAPRTIEKYELVARNVMAWSDDDGRRRAATMTEADFWAFRRYLLDMGLCEKTAHDRCIVVKQAFKWAAGSGKLIPSNPLVGISMRKPESTPQPCFTPEQVAMLLAKADDHFRPIWALFVYTGMRFGEVAALRWDDVSFDDKGGGSIHVRDGGSGRTKSGRSRRIPLHPQLRKCLAPLPRQHERVFITPPTDQYPTEGRPLDERRLIASLKRLCRRCGFADPNQYKLHTFRHTFASICACANTPYKYALEWMGHRSSEVFDIYFKSFDQMGKDAMGAIHYPTLSSEADTATAARPQRGSLKRKISA